MTSDALIAWQSGIFASLSTALPVLLKQYADQSAPHALMISGQFGVGKATLSGLLARALLCEAAGHRPCGACPGCRKTQSLSHPNLLQVRAAQKQRSVKVEQARALIASLSSYPFETGPRVVLLELVDTFTVQAQNALLKAVEEPDSATYFLLTCQNEQAVLSTIRSRCRMVRLPDWPDALIAQVLIQQGIARDEATKLTALAQGSPGKALQIKEDASFWSAKQLADETLLAITNLEQLPEASARLRDARDKADVILDYVQGAALRLAQDAAFDPDAGLRAQQLLESVLAARKFQASNLSWQAIADWMLLTIIKENTICQV
jgi:DNA polymerase-3 subunit delta'